ncbi:MAG: hypothetical protein U0X20_01455 [Caldilineaceae bacterium]
MPHNVPRERIVLFGLAALAVIALVFGAISSGVSAGQQEAWMQGYTMGRLTAAAGVDGAAAGVTPAGVAPVAPFVAPYAMGYRSHGPGFPGFLFILLAIGGVFFVVRMIKMSHWRRYAAMQGWQGGWPQGGPQPGAQQGGPQADWQQGPPPWMRGHWGCGPWGGPWEQQGAQQPQAAQPVPPQQPPAQQPGQASDQPAGER